MSHQEQLQQSLLELHYGLLDDAEANELRGRIETDAEVAAIWAQTLELAGQFADAANLAGVSVGHDLDNRLKPPTDENHAGGDVINRLLDDQPSTDDSIVVAEVAPTNGLAAPYVEQVFPPNKDFPNQSEPSQLEHAPEHAPAKNKPADMDRRVRRHRQWMLVVVGLASCLLCIVVGRFFVGIPAPPELVLQIQAESSGGDDSLRNQFDIFTNRLTGKSLGAADVIRGVSASLSVAIKTGDVVLHRSDVQTDSAGRASYVVPTKLKLPRNAMLYIQSDVVESDLVVPLEPTRCLTYLTSDKPIYRPGETIRFRSLTLERFSLRGDVDLPIRYEMLDPSGAVVSNAKIDGVTSRGVGNGEFRIPQSAPGGPYKLVAKSLDGFFPTESRKIIVQNYRTPRFKKDLEFRRRSYGPGETVEADFEAVRAEGGTASPMDVNVTAKVDGSVIFEERSKTDSAGRCTVSFKLPDFINRGVGTLAVAIDDGGTQEVQARTIPIQLGRVQVDFYPEGGYLVNGLRNRVYFAAHNLQGEPIHVAGEILNQNGKRIAEIETARDGMGKFEFVPDPRDKYVFKVTDPVDVTNSPALPKGVDHLPVLSSGKGVFGNQEDVAFEIQTLQERPIVIQAVCRGQLVAEQALELRAGLTKLKLDLPRHVEGVIRLTVFDGTANQAHPLVERLVYREGIRKLRIKVDESESALERTPGEPVRLSLSVTDENGQPAPSVLGVAVVDDAALSLEPDERPSMSTHFVLTSEIEKPEDLEHANFYLSGTEESRASLDLLLGTQGWRRFVSSGPSMTGSESIDVDKSAFSEQVARLVEMDGTSSKGFIHSNVQSSNRQWTQYSLAVSANWDRFISELKWLVLPVVFLLILLYFARPKFQLSSAIGLWVLMAFGYALIVGCGQASVPAVAPAKSNATMDVDDTAASMPPQLPPPPPLPPIPDGFDDKSEDANDQARYADDNFDNAKEKLEPADKKKKIQIVEQPDAQGVAGFGPGQNKTMGGKFADLAPSESKSLEISRAVLDQLIRARGLAPGDLGKGLLDELRFPIREYAHRHVSTRDDMREDFTETLYWQPLLITNSQGKASIQFELSDSVTTFRVMADAHSNGRIGSGGGELVSRLPFQIEPKMPLAVTAGDQIHLPVAVINATDDNLQVGVDIRADSVFNTTSNANLNLELAPQQRTRAYFELDVVSGQNEIDATIDLKGAAGSDALSDSIRRKIQVSPSGYPISESVSGILNESVNVLLPIPDDIVPGSLQVTLKAYPSPLADMLSGVESILREPHGCFEQTSATNYPNTMALQYLQENHLSNPKLTRRAKALLQKGYSKLVSFECKQRGYEWFGSDPGHEALSAFGLLQFNDMASVMEVDARMVARTRKWLLDRRDGNGSFQRNPRHLHVWSVKQQIVDAYVLWAVTEADVASGNPQRAASELATELARLHASAEQSKDPYLVSLAAASLMNVQRTSDAKALLDKLVDLQKENGELVGTTTVTQSGGVSRSVETTALAILAWTKASSEYVPQVQSAATWLVKNRQGHGGFGSTQATVLALKALIAYSRNASASYIDGELLVKHNDKVIGRAKLPKEAKGGTTIEITGLGQHLRAGETSLELVADGANRLPFSVEVLYHTQTPPSDKRCPLDLETSLVNSSGQDGRVDSGAILQVKATVRNRSNDGLPMTVATIGLPGGVEPRVENLNELRDEGIFDYYEIRPREVVCYWRSIAPAETKEITFDATAEIAGKYTGPASRAYLYYTAEQKTWTEPLAIEIAK